MNSVVWMALIATLGTWFVTALGAATLVFFKSPNPKVLNFMLGFASGVMIAASFWSLLQSAIERVEAVSNLPAYFVATAGFLLGAIFIWVSDKVISLTRRKLTNTQESKNTRLGRIIMLILSITLDNILEGLRSALPLAFCKTVHIARKILWVQLPSPSESDCKIFPRGRRFPSLFEERDSQESEAFCTVRLRAWLSRLRA